MKKKYSCILFIFVVLSILICFPGRSVAKAVKISVFNFQAINLDASGYGTTVTNQLMNFLMAEPDFDILDRKEMEAFLSLNDLQQNDKEENVLDIGARLGLDIIVVGTAEKKGDILQIACKVISIKQKRVALSKLVRFLGDARLDSEISALGEAVKAAIVNVSSNKEEKTAFKGPVNIQKRSGNRRIVLSWEDAPDTKAVAYEVFRATAKEGPFAKVAQVNRPEFLDQNVENGLVYYYKIKGFNNSGLPSEFSLIYYAETALTPNPPVILKTESHIKSISLVWTPSPISSDDPSRLRGYKLYRAGSEKGIYKWVANILGKDLGIGVDTASTLDKLLKVNYTDRGLLDGENCYYKLTAYNERNLESEFSPVVMGSTLPAVAVPEVQGDMLREIGLAWTPLNSPDIKGYYVYRTTNEDAGYAKISKVDETDGSGGKKIYYKDADGLADNTRYYYRVSAFESPDLETAPSVAVSAQTKGKPPAPEGFAATGGLVKIIELRWKAGAAEDVEGYNLYSSGSSDGEYVLIKKLAGTDNNKYTDTGRDGVKFEDNVTYYYRLTSYNKFDVESLPTPAFATTKPRPSKPTDITGVGGKVKEVPLSWKANPERDISYYRVFRNANPGSNEFSHIAKIEDKTFYTDKDLKDGATYRYALQVEDRDGLLSDFSESITIATKPRPRSPAGVNSEILSGMFQLKWEPASEPDIAYYTVYEKKFFGNEKIITVTETTFSEPALPKGKSKTYVVTATDKDGLESEPSREITITGR
ncbi:MAG: hypothetical protein Q7J31_13875 [Syntrophales bacterium]|nr:hypothetical protein [Syntrophales bacterium]